MRFNIYFLVSLLSLGIFMLLLRISHFMIVNLHLKYNFNLIVISKSDACDNKPCKYGKCVSNENATIRCICFPKWSGEFCDKSSLNFNYYNLNLKQPFTSYFSGSFKTRSSYKQAQKTKYPIACWFFITVC